MHGQHFLYSQKSENQLPEQQTPGPSGKKLRAMVGLSTLSGISGQNIQHLQMQQ
jgi:hypothetical protein